MRKKIFGLLSVIAVSFMLMVPQTASAVSDDNVRAMMASVNEQLAAMGENVRLGQVDLYTNNALGRIVYIEDRGNKQMETHWVPGDPNRWYPPRFDLTWLSETIDVNDINGGVSGADGRAAIDRAIATWNGVECSNIPLVELPDYGIDWGYTEYVFSIITGIPFGGYPGWYADVTQAGWQPPIFFELVEPGGSEYILAVTYTYWWVSGGVPTDMDGNGKNDTAFAEVYYNNAFQWGIDVTYPSYDIETVALHEMGHGLSQDHFGGAFRTLPNGMLHFNPRAVMNSANSGIQQELTGTDIAGHCSIWASWPNN